MSVLPKALRCLFGTVFALICLCCALVLAFLVVVCWQETSVYALHRTECRPMTAAVFALIFPILFVVVIGQAAGSAAIYYFRKPSLERFQ